MSIVIFPEGSVAAKRGGSDGDEPALSLDLVSAYARAVPKTPEQHAKTQEEAATAVAASSCLPERFSAKTYSCTSITPSAFMVTWLVPASTSGVALSLEKAEAFMASCLLYTSDAADEA